MYEDYREQIDDAFGNLGSHDYFQQIKGVLLRRLIGELQNETGTCRVLDIGAGTGTLLHEIPGSCVRVGIEPDSDMIRQIPKRADRLAIVNGTGTALPFRDACFDMVYMSCVLHHVAHEDLLTLIKECARVIRAGGHLIVFEHNAYNLPVVFFLKKFVKIDRHARFLTPRAARRLVREAELRPARLRYMCFFPQFLKFLLRVEQYLHWLPVGGQYCLIAVKDA